MEERKTDPATGGQKGVKPEAYAYIPWDVMSEVARTYHYGSSKYADDEVGAYNWKRGYAWSQSFSALMRHATAFWEGEDRDPESGLHHLAHAAWHCLTLMWFGLHSKGTDDRSSKEKDEEAYTCRVFYRSDDGVLVDPDASLPPAYPYPDARSLYPQSGIGGLGARTEPAGYVLDPRAAGKAPTTGG